jgi:formate dehydrogenase major subunit
VLDPFGKIPEFKYCAVKLMRGGELTPRSSYGGGEDIKQLYDCLIAAGRHRRWTRPAQR